MEKKKFCLDLIEHAAFRCKAAAGIRLLLLSTCPLSLPRFFQLARSSRKRQALRGSAVALRGFNVNLGIHLPVLRNLQVFFNDALYQRLFPQASFDASDRLIELITRSG